MIPPGRGEIGANVKPAIQKVPVEPVVPPIGVASATAMLLLPETKGMQTKLYAVHAVWIVAGAELFTQ